MKRYVQVNCTQVLLKEHLNRLYETLNADPQVYSTVYKTFTEQRSSVRQNFGTALKLKSAF